MRMRWLPVALVMVAGCSGGPAPTASDTASIPPSDPPASVAPTPRPVPDLVPSDGGTWFGMNLDWANDSVAAVSERLGATPSVWVQFVTFPLDEAGRANLELFVAQVAAVHGIALITLEPMDGLDAVTPDAADDFARLLADYWEAEGVPSVVRFAHEMNGSWYPWGQQPSAYVAAFRRVAAAVHALSPTSAMAWAPNEGSGYPFAGGAYASTDPALDTNGDGHVARGDDPYAPYWPGDDAVDWVGMSVYHWGLAYPWGENELPAAGEFAALMTGGSTGAHDEEVAIPDFYAAYADGHDKPMGVFETAALYNPVADGASESEIKTAWWSQLTAATVRDRFPRLAMVNWFEWRKEEPEVGGVIDWRLSGDPELGRRLLASTPPGRFRFGGWTADAR